MMTTPQPTPQEREMILALRILDTVDRNTLVKVLIDMTSRVVASMIEKSDMTQDEHDAMVFRTAAVLVMEEEGKINLSEVVQ